MYESPIWLTSNQADCIVHSHLKPPIKQALHQISFDSEHFLQRFLLQQQSQSHVMATRSNLVHFLLRYPPKCSSSKENFFFFIVHYSQNPRWVKQTPTFRTHPKSCTQSFLERQELEVLVQGPPDYRCQTPPKHPQFSAHSTRIHELKNLGMWSFAQPSQLLCDTGANSSSMSSTLRKSLRFHNLPLDMPRIQPLKEPTHRGFKRASGTR